MGDVPKLPLSVTEASEQTGIPKRTLQAAIARGDLKGHQMPGRTGAYMIEQRDLDRYMAKREKLAAERSEAS